VKIKEEIRGDVAVISLSGKLMGGPETSEFHDHIKGLIADGMKKVVVDLGKVKWLNSSGLGALMGAYTSLKNAGGDLKLAQVTERVQSILMITKLITIFDTYESAERAVASFGR